MAKKKRGWWSQIQSNDYPESQKQYGNKDWVAFNIGKDKLIESINEEVNSKESSVRLQNDCPNCGELYWIDKLKCYHCGYNIAFKKEADKEVENETKLDEIIQKRDIQKLNYTMLCSKCGSKMVLLTAKKEKIKAISFGVVANFQNVEGHLLTERFFSYVCRALPAD